MIEYEAFVAVESFPLTYKKTLFEELPATDTGRVQIKRFVVQK